MNVADIVLLRRIAILEQRRGQVAAEAALTSSIDAAPSDARSANDLPSMFGAEITVLAIMRSGPLAAR